MIIGSFPIGKFSDPKRKHEIKAHEIDFYFGGEKNLLWRLIGESFGRTLDSKAAIISLLEEKGIALGDVIVSCKRKEGRASDSDLYDIKWNHELLGLLKKNNIKKVLFTSRQVHKWFKRLFPDAGLEEVQLISPSAQSARSIVRSKEYLDWKKKHPNGRTWDFILANYRLKLRALN